MAHEKRGVLRGQRFVLHSTEIAVIAIDEALGWQLVLVDLLAGSAGPVGRNCVCHPGPVLSIVVLIFIPPGAQTLILHDQVLLVHGPGEELLLIHGLPHIVVRCLLVCVDLLRRICRCRLSWSSSAVAWRHLRLLVALFNHL